MLNIIHTFDGSTALREKCKKIKGKYYEENRQCFFVNGRWYRINSGFIEKDWGINKWILKSDTRNLSEGIVDFNTSSDKPIWGKFTSSRLDNVIGEEVKISDKCETVEENKFSYQLKYTPTNTDFTNQYIASTEEDEFFASIEDNISDSIDEETGLNFSEYSNESGFVSALTNIGDRNLNFQQLSNALARYREYQRTTGIRPIIRRNTDLRNDSEVKWKSSSNSRINYVNYLNEEVAIKCGLVEDVSTGNFHFKDTFKDYNEPGVRSFRGYNFSINYQAKYKIAEFSEIYNLYNKFYDSDISKLLCGRTFGIEFESSRGNIPERHLWKNGLIALRDGSITSYEYSTIPLSGQTGLNSIKKHCELLQKYTLIDKNCSLHIHLGNLPISKEFFMSTYILNNSLEDEIYSMFPPYYKETGKFKSTGHNYCNPLRKFRFTKEDSLDTKFDRIYQYYSSGMPFENFEPREHPNDNRGTSKWRVGPARYHFISFLPYLFGNSKTIEFRIHGPSQNPTKILNWLFITNAILEYSIRYSNMIIDKSTTTLLYKNITLADIISIIYKDNPNVIKYLIEYIEYRKEFIQNSVNKYEDMWGKIELETDKEFTFNNMLIDEFD